MNYTQYKSKNAAKRPMSGSKNWTQVLKMASFNKKFMAFLSQKEGVIRAINFKYKFVFENISANEWEIQKLTVFRQNKFYWFKRQFINRQTNKCYL